MSMLVLKWLNRVLGRSLFQSHLYLGIPWWTSGRTLPFHRRPDRSLVGEQRSYKLCGALNGAFHLTTTTKMQHSDITGKNTRRATLEGVAFELVSGFVEPVTSEAGHSIPVKASPSSVSLKLGSQPRSLLGLEEPTANSRLSFTFRTRKKVNHSNLLAC